MEWRRDNCLITDDPAKIVLPTVIGLLKDTYWAAQRPAAATELAIRNSLCFSLYSGAQMIGFARALTDVGAYTMLCDVVIADTHRHLGLGTWFVECILSHPQIAGTKVLLVTKDAQTFYAKHGFKTHPFECMMRT